LALLQRRGNDLQKGQQGHGVIGSSSTSLVKRVADGAFWGYVGVAVAVLLFQVAQDHRFGRSLARARLCIAQQDSTCVSRELEVESSIRQADPHMELAAASLSLLLHRPSTAAQATADRLEIAQGAALAAMPVELRGDVLLLRSDIAIADADLARARESIDAARALLGESDLTSLRRRRLEALEDDLTARKANGVEALRQAFEGLLEAAAADNRALTDVRQAACSDWINRVADAGARRQLVLALQAAGRASQPRYGAPGSGAYRIASSEPPPLPSKAAGYDNIYGSGSYEDRMQRYRERLARYEKEQGAIRERENQRAAEASAAKQAALDQAKEALSAGMAALSSSPAPFTDSPQPARASTAGSGSVGK